MTRDVTTLLDSFFPSSKPANLLFEAQDGRLPSGETYRYMVVSSFYFPDGDKLVRLCNLTLATGLTPESLCRYGMGACFDDGAGHDIKTITESNCRISGNNLQRRADHYQRDSGQGDEWKFGEKLERFRSFLAGVEGAYKEIPSSHPLLNPVKARSARNSQGDGGGEISR